MAGGGKLSFQNVGEADVLTFQSLGGPRVHLGGQSSAVKSSFGSKIFSVLNIHSTSSSLPVLRSAQSR